MKGKSKGTRLCLSSEKHFLRSHYSIFYILKKRYPHKNLLQFYLAEHKETDIFVFHLVSKETLTRKRS
jgi:hypothetical protein